jgi:hypothetical protein
MSPLEGGLEIPILGTRLINVVRFKPSLAAAPFAPSITQPTACRVCRISAHSEPFKVVWEIEDNLSLGCRQRIVKHAIV